MDTSSVMAVAVKAEIVFPKLNPDEDNHTSDLTLTAEQLLEKLEKDPELCRKHSKSGGMCLDDIKRAAKHISLPHSNVSKNALIDAVVNKLKNKSQLNTILLNKNEGSTFREDENTFFRVLNFLMTNPDSLARSSLLAGRLQLEEGKVKDRQDIYTTAAEQFNDWSQSSGGYIVLRMLFYFFVINMFL